MKSTQPKKVILIGASSGGPGQISKIVKALPKLTNTSIVIAQHMAEGFLDSFVYRLFQPSLNNIQIIKDTTFFSSNNVYVCENSMTLHSDKNRLFFIEQEKTSTCFNPNINLMFDSFVKLHEDMEILSVILTGIGSDGVDASLNLSKKDVRVLTETSESAIIDGMPCRARELIPNVEVYSMNRL